MPSVAKISDPSLSQWRVMLSQNEILGSLFIQNVANIVCPHNIRENTILGVNNPNLSPFTK
jgi:hypothetical protein